MRIARMSMVLLFVSLLFVSQAAFAQIGVQTAKPVSTTDSATDSTTTSTTNSTSAQMNVTSTSTDAPDCTIPTGRLPLMGKTSADALCFWNMEDQDYLKYARFISSAKSMTASTEMVTDVFGTVRLAFAVAVAATTDDDSTTTSADSTDDDEATADQDQTLNLFSTNGGNLSLTASYPLYYKPIGNGQFLWNSYARLAGNVDAMGGDTEVTVAVGDDDVNANLEVAFSEMQVDLLSYQDKFNLLGYAKASGVLGTKKFAAALGDDVGRSFLHGQIGAGLRVTGKLTVYVSYNWYSDDAIPGNGGTITLVMGD
jgi:hypothetical protein